MKFTVTVTIEADDIEDAEEIRSEIAMSLQDADDAGELPDGASYDVDDLIEEK